MRVVGWVWGWGQWWDFAVVNFGFCNLNRIGSRESFKIVNNCMQIFDSFTVIFFNIQSSWHLQEILTIIHNQPFFFLQNKFIFYLFKICCMFSFLYWTKITKIEHYTINILFIPVWIFHFFFLHFYNKLMYWIICYAGTAVLSILKYFDRCKYWFVMLKINIVELRKRVGEDVVFWWFFQF